jgi:hypothetical protein
MRVLDEKQNVRRSLVLLPLDELLLQRERGEVIHPAKILVMEHDRLP